MASRNVVLSETLIKEKKGIVVLTLEEYERMREDLEMLRAKKLVKDIEKARKEAKSGKTVTLEETKQRLKL